MRAANPAFITQWKPKGKQTKEINRNNHGPGDRVSGIQTLKGHCTERERGWSLKVKIRMVTEGMCFFRAVIYGGLTAMIAAASSWKNQHRLKTVFKSPLLDPLLSRKCTMTISQVSAK